MPTWIQAVDALIGAGYGSAGRALHWRSRSRFRRQRPPLDRLMEKADPRVEALKIGTSIDPYRPTTARW